MGRTEKELADAISEQVNISERAGREFTQKLLEAIADDLVTTGRVELRGLGIIALSTRKARTIRHPKTGKIMKIPQTRFVRFRASIDIRRRLNHKPSKLTPSQQQ
jgi:nucleoid DNA-binding protein